MNRTSPDMTPARDSGKASLLLLLTILVLGWALWQLPSAYGEYGQAQKFSLRALDLREKILLYDEVLTMSARLCAATGSREWEQRYRQHEPMLDQVLREAVKMFPGPGLARMTQQANDKLVAWEHRALDLARRGQLQAAQAVFDDEYQRQKALYAKGIGDLDQSLQERSRINLSRADSRLRLAGWAFFVTSAGLVLVWLSIGFRTHAWNSVLVNRNRELDEQAERLRQAHHMLEESQHHLLQVQKLELVGTLASGIAHDFNNQLVPILGHLELLLADPLPPEQRESLVVVQRAAKNCRQLVRGLMSLRRSSAVEKSDIDIGDMLAELKDFLQHVFPAAIHCDFEIEEGLPSVRGTLAELHSVCLNLAANARDAMMPGGGRLLIAARSQGDSVQLVFKDDGHGMSKEVLGKIFEPFFTTKDDHAGTGLGLFSVKKILEDHGATLQIESQPGRGSEFLVTFAGVLKSESRDSSPPPRPALTSKAQRVLLVDDEEAIRRITSRHLSKQGMDVVLACNGLEALERYDPQCIDVVVSDINMPELDGLSLLSEILKINPQAVVILVSGLDVEDGAAQGAAAVLRKPFEFQHLIEVIQTKSRKPPISPGTATT